MDYHIDWIQGSLVLAHPDQYAGPLIYNPDRVVKGTQEDVDLLIAFRDADDMFNLILVEAKGYSSWNNKQMTSKIGRRKRCLVIVEKNTEMSNLILVDI